MKGRSTEVGVSYDAKRKLVLEILRINFSELGLTEPVLSDFYPVLDAVGSVSDAVHYGGEIFSLCNILLKKYHLPAEIVVAEMNGLTNGQAVALQELYQHGFRGAHLRKWKPNSQKRFASDHVTALHELRKWKIPPGDAVQAIDAEPAGFYINMLIHAARKLLQAWLNHTITLPPDAVINMLDWVNRRFQGHAKSSLPHNSCLIVKDRATTEFLIRWLNKDFVLSAEDETRAISLLDENDFSGISCSVPLTPGQSRQLANTLALANLRRGNLVVAYRLHQHHQLNMSILNLGILEDFDQRKHLIGDLYSYDNHQDFVRALTVGLGELERSKELTKCGNEIAELYEEYKEFIAISCKAKTLASKYKFTLNEATMFVCSATVRDLVRDSIFNKLMMAALEGAATYAAKTGQPGPAIYIEEMSHEITMADLYSMINKYMAMYVKPAIDTALNAYYWRNRFYLDQRCDRSESMRVTAAEQETRGNVKKMIHYQFGLITGTLPAEQIKGELKHEKPLSKPMSEEDDFRQTMSSLKTHPRLIN